jgi:hypothetical protein
MSFFEEAARQHGEPKEVWKPGILGRYLPGIVPVELVLAHNDRGCIAISYLAVVPDAVCFTLTAFNGPALADEWDDTGHEFEAPGELRYGGRGRAEHGVVFGAQFPDGVKVTTLQPYHPGYADAEYGLDHEGGHGSAHRYDHELCLWPLPSAGTLDLVVAWPAADITETHTELDTAPIISAAQRTHPAWPDEAGLPSHPSPTYGRWQRPDEPS